MTESNPSSHTFGPAGRPLLRQRRERQEEALSPHATRAVRSRGRIHPEPPCPMRTAFQRDRDRVLHCKAFRRLKHKTQVFIAPAGDHYVTRLTHTLEVAQIARTLARALNLNEDLTEAIALAHDMGHTPFGHLGEQLLDGVVPGGFAHAAQSLRVVDFLEKDGQGLNLTHEVRQGILFHSKPRGDLLGADSVNPDDPLTLEAQVCRIADAVAYLNHDILDAVRAGVLREEDLPAEARRVLGTRHAQRIDTMVWDIVEVSWPVTGEVELPPGATPSITMSPQVRATTNLLREFLFQQVYLPASRRPEATYATRVLSLLFDHFCKHPEEVPADFPRREEPVERTVADYLAGMTDQYALRTADRIRPGLCHDLLR